MTNKLNSFTLEALAGTISSRAGAEAGASYTKSLMEAGVARCAKKFGEEAVEAVIAAMEGDRAHLTAEAADVLYHLLVLLHVGGVSLHDVLDELERRTAQSGHAEKASRSGDGKAS
jgi:phosphoribosyl-ATP pyrophosphohydrolase